MIKQITRASQSSKAFTLVELLVVVAIIALLVSILLPTLGKAKEQAYRVRCLAHMRGLMTAHAIYAAEFNDFLPGPAGVVRDMETLGEPNDPYGIWATLPIETGLLFKTGALTTPEFWLCPKVTLSSPGAWYGPRGYSGWTPEMIKEHPYTFHFTYNARTFLNPAWDRYPADPNPKGNMWVENGMRSVSTFGEPARTILLSEENTGMVPDDIGSCVIQYPWFNYSDSTEPRHLGDATAGYLDGHAGMLPPYVSLFYDEEYWPVLP